MNTFLRSVVVASLLTGGAAASAAPVLGGQLYYTGGTVTVTTLPVSSGYTTELGLYDSSLTRIFTFTPSLFDEPAGESRTFDPSTLGYMSGDELIFGIRNIGVPSVPDFHMGPSSRNSDGLAHATVDAIGGGFFDVGFEDLENGGDLDFNDNVFRFEGGVRDVPAPAGLGLMLLGVAGLVRRSGAKA